MSSSSRSVNSLEPSDVIPLCYCRPPLRAKERESWKDRNPARRFFNCPNSLTDRDSCNFFQWKDHELSTHYKTTILKMKKRLADIDAACKSLEVGHLLSNLLSERAKRQIDKDLATQKINELQELYDIAVTQKAELEAEKLIVVKKIEEMEELVGKLKSKNQFMGRLVLLLVVILLWMLLVR